MNNKLICATTLATMLSIGANAADTDLGTAVISKTGTVDKQTGVLSDEAMAKQALPFAQLSNGIYSHKDAGGYDFKQTETDIFEAMHKEGLLSDLALTAVKLLVKASGFQAGTYNNDQGQTVLAFAGTQNSPADIFTDIANSLGNIQEMLSPLGFIVSTKDPQYTLAEIASTYISSKTSNLVFTGHSLGGGLAQHAAKTVSGSSGKKVQTIVFNSATPPGVKSGFKYLEGSGDHIVNISLDKDPVSFLDTGVQQGIHYKYHTSKYSVLGSHSISSVIETLEYASGLKSKPAVNWARVNLARNSMLALVQANTSHIGSASTSYNINNSYYKTSGTNATYTQTIPDGVFVSPKNFTESQWVLNKGNSNNLTVSSTYGSIKPYAGLPFPISALNNAGQDYTQISKSFIVPEGVNTASIRSILNFVTTEYPAFVGSQYNDTGLVQITSPGGKVYATQLSASVNGSNYTTVTNLPGVMAGYNASDSGGQTGWVTPHSQIKVAPGGQVQVKITVDNIGDEAYPSAILVNSLSIQ